MEKKYEKLRFIKVQPMIVRTMYFKTNIHVYVQRKVRISTIPELYLRKVRIPTLSADSGIVPDNSRIAQGVFY